MSIITKFLSVVTEPQFKLARDLTAMAIADGHMTTSRNYFQGDIGTRTFASFIKNYIDPKGKTEKANRENLRMLYDTVANNTEMSQDAESDREILRQNLSRATEAFLENTILVKEFKDVGVDFPTILKQEELFILKRYMAH